MRAADAPRRVVVIGLDSFDPVRAQEWMAEGILPNLAAFRQGGLVGDVTNPAGSESGGLWNDFFIGGGLGTHGLYNGTRQFNPNSYRYDQSLAQAQPTYLWTVLTQASRRSVIIDAPYQLPPGEHIGLFIADWCAHYSYKFDGDLTPTSVPPERIGQIIEEYGADTLGGRSCDHHAPRTAAEHAWLRDSLIERIGMKTRLTTDLLEHEDWDLFGAFFTDAHCVGHRSLHICDPTHPEYDAEMAQQLGNPLRDIYIALDNAFGQIREATPADCALFVHMSHGIGTPYSGTRLLDRILARLEGDFHKQPDGMRKKLQTAWRSLPVSVRQSLFPLKEWIRPSIFRIGRGAPIQSRRFFEIVNNDRTGGVRINLKGRDAEGIVEPEDYDALCAMIVGELEQVTNDDTGQPLVARIDLARDIHNGPKLAMLPDILVTWNREQPIRSVSSPRIGTVAHPEPNSRTGDHRPGGTFIAQGPGFRTGRMPHAVEVAQFAPTFAALINVDPGSFGASPIDDLISQRHQAAE